MMMGMGVGASGERGAQPPDPDAGEHDANATFTPYRDKIDGQGIPKYQREQSNATPSDARSPGPRLGVHRIWCDRGEVIGSRNHVNKAGEEPGNQECSEENGSDVTAFLSLVARSEPSAL